MEPHKMPLEVLVFFGEVDVLWYVRPTIGIAIHHPPPIVQEHRVVQNCGNYGCVKFISQSMKMWERVIDRWLREETKIHDPLFGFMPGKWNNGPIHILCIKSTEVETLREVKRTVRGSHEQLVSGCIWASSQTRSLNPYCSTLITYRCTSKSAVCR